MDKELEKNAIRWLQNTRRNLIEKLEPIAWSVSINKLTPKLDYRQFTRLYRKSNYEFLILLHTTDTQSIKSKLNNLPNIKIIDINMMEYYNSNLDEDKNYIFISTRVIDIDFLKRINRPLLVVRYNIQLLNSQTLIGRTIRYYKTELFIKRINPFLLIQGSMNSTFRIEGTISIFLRHIIFNSLGIHLKSNKVTKSVDYIYQVEADLKVLKDYKILTSRLANLIYKISTFHFDYNNTKIGNFIRSSFSVKSKAMRLPGGLHTTPVKAYDLRKKVCT